VWLETVRRVVPCDLLHDLRVLEINPFLILRDFANRCELWIVLREHIEVYIVVVVGSHVWVVEV